MYPDGLMQALWGKYTRMGTDVMGMGRDLWGWGRYGKNKLSLCASPHKNNECKTLCTAGWQPPNTRLGTHTACKQAEP